MVAPVESMPPRALLDDLLDWLRIPSISTDGAHRPELEQAARWAAQRIRSAKGHAELVQVGDGNPLVVGDLAASHAGAPTVLIYGHYDVAGAEPVDAWNTSPFEPVQLDGRIYARGASDDKGNFLPLLHAACELAAQRRLPVNVRILLDGEEETFGRSAAEWLSTEAELPDCAIVFDGDMVDRDTPAITVGLRGAVQMRVCVRTATQDLHSGEYGGVSLNAVHALHAMLAAVMPCPDGRVAALLRAGSEVAGAWSSLSPGELDVRAAGGRPLAHTNGKVVTPPPGEEPSLDVNEFRAGAPRGVIPATATATLTLRLVPGQRAAKLAATLERLLRDAAPENADVELSAAICQPAMVPTDTPAMGLAAKALADVCGSAPVFVRIGGSIPIVAELAGRGVPVVMTGFALPEDGAHGPNESIAIDRVQLAESAAYRLLEGLAAAPKRCDATAAWRVSAGAVQGSSELAGRDRPETDPGRRDLDAQSRRGQRPAP